MFWSGIGLRKREPFFGLGRELGSGEGLHGGAMKVRLHSV